MLPCPHDARYLLDACEAHPLIDFRWGNKVVAVAQDADAARIEIDTPEGPYTLQTEWLVAADGGRSPIRTAMELQMEGASYEGFFVIADIRIDLPLPTERLALCLPQTAHVGHPRRTDCKAVLTWTLPCYGPCPFGPGSPSNASTAAASYARKPCSTS